MSITDRTEITARDAWLGSLTWEPGQPFLDPARDARQDRALAEYRAAKEAAETPQLRASRLIRQALDKEVIAETCDAEAAEFHGKARYREIQGEHDLAATFRQRAQGAERYSTKLYAEAEAFRSEAYAIIDHAANAKALMSIGAAR